MRKRMPAQGGSAYYPDGWVPDDEELLSRPVVESGDWVEYKGAIRAA